MRLAGKVALVILRVLRTGAQGIGRRIAPTFAREGARVTIGDVQDEGGRTTAPEVAEQAAAAA